MPEFCFTTPISLTAAIILRAFPVSAVKAPSLSTTSLPT